MYNERRFYSYWLDYYHSLITLPAEGWFIKTATSLLFTYIIGDRMRFITIETREKVAQFLKDHHIIHDYRGIIDDVRMEERKMFTVTGSRGEPVMLERISELTWDKIRFCKSEVIQFAAEKEIYLAGHDAGLFYERPKSKVRTLYDNFFRAA